MQEKTEQRKAIDLKSQFPKEKKIQSSKVWKMSSQFLLLNKYESKSKVTFDLKLVNI